LAATRVIVIGAGPVGVSAALTLASAGVQVDLFESTAGPSSASHASTFHPPTLEIFNEFGLANEFIERGIKVRTLQYRDRDDGVLAEFDYSALDDATSFPFRLQAEQREFTKMACARLAQYRHVNIHFNTEINSVRTDGTSAVAQASESEYRADWIIAADGAKSSARKALGIGFQGNTYQMRYLTVKTKADLREFISGLSPVTYVSGGPDGFGVLQLPDHWRIALRVPEGVPENTATSAAYIESRLHKTLPDGPVEVPVLDHFIYFIHRRSADQFKVGRVLLAGDAAHLNSPSGGMGMNSGIHDAYVLARTICELGQDQDAAHSALEDVSNTRKYVADEIIGVRSDRNYRAITTQDQVARAEYRVKMRGIAGDWDEAREYLMRASMLDHAPRPDQTIADFIGEPSRGLER